jgi:hypothetical protein
VKSGRCEVVGRSGMAAMSSDDNEGGGASRRSQHSSRDRIRVLRWGPIATAVNLVP